MVRVEALSLGRVLLVEPPHPVPKAEGTRGELCGGKGRASGSILIKARRE